MESSDMKQEEISALADGELDAPQLDALLAALRRPDQHATWDIYHQIGDALRSDDLGIALSPDFSARMAARLAAEPPLLAPSKTVQTKPARQWSLKRFMVPGMAAVAGAVASVAFIAAPQLMVALNSDTSGASPSDSQTMLAVRAPSVGGTDRAINLVADRPSTTAQTVAAQDGVMLRDADIDDYLLAHQRFSPSVYSTAQYARSATFATDTEK
jgi:sigma-E factor negative regulatory protein RseA